MSGLYLALAAAWIVWCLLHSLLAAPSVERRVRRGMGEWGRWYRLAYNLFAVASVAPVVAYEKLRASGLAVDWGRGEPARMILFWGSLALLVWVARAYGFHKFSGLDPAGGEDGMYGELVIAGPLEKVRHPLYALAYVILWTRPLTDTALASNAVLTVYLLIGTWLEERKLAARFGPRYESYQRETPMYVPWRWALSLFGMKTR